MKTLLKYIIYTNLVVALSAGILSAGFCFMQEIESWELYGLFSLFSTLAVYNGQRLFKTNDNKETDWLIWVKNHKKILIAIVFFSSLISVVLFFFIDNHTTVIYFLFVIVCCISILYVVRINGRNMRELPYIKIHLIALTWVMVLFLFPMVNEEINDSKIGYSSAFYLYVLAVTIPFDIRDLKYDQVSQRTIPQLLGVFRSKILAVILLLISTVIFIMLAPTLRVNPLFILSMITQLVLILKMHKNRDDFYCAGLIDGAIAVLGLSFFF